MGTRLEGPVQIAGKLPQIVVRRWIGKARTEKSLAGSTGETCIAANGESKLIRIGKTIPNVAGNAAVEKRIIHALTVGMKVRAGKRVVKFIEKPAHLYAAASGRKAAAFGEKIGFRYARGTLVADDLNDAGHSVGAIKGALCAMNDLDFVHVIEREIGKVRVATRKIHRSAVDEHFCKAGISAVDKDVCEAANGAGSREADARLCREEIGKRNCLALSDFLTADEINGRRSVVE